MSDEEFDGQKLLDTTLHGTIIPTCLLLVGIAIFDWRYTPIGIAIALVLIGFRIKRGMAKKTNLKKGVSTELELIDKTIVSHNTAIYSFALKDENQTLMIPIGHHLQVTVPIQGKDEIRYYTPISSREEKGSFDLLIKSYPKGKVSSYFAGLRPHQTIKFSGPVGRMNYTSNLAKEIGMIAGGSGITPILQILAYITTTPEDTTKISLIYANETEDDILLKEELDELNEKYPYFNVHYIINKSTSSSSKLKWNGNIGYITSDLILKYLPSPKIDNKLFICGPPAMNKSLKEITENLGWEKSSVPSKQEDQVFFF